MKYSLATNFDFSLVEYIKDYDQKKQIKSVYGKLKQDVLGGGRASMVLPKLSMDDLEKYIKACHDSNIEFNYLFNPMCLDNKDIDKKQQSIIIKFIDELVSMGTDALTVNSPYMCRVIRNRYPNLKITIGAYAVSYSIQHIMYWKEMGADEITLHHKVNRDFKLLESMLRYSAEKEIILRLIGNNLCLKDCPFQISHGTEQSHVSRLGDHKIFFDLDLISCTYKKLQDVTKIISSEWIRPEDVKVYDELCYITKNENLSIKLVERTKKTDFLTRVVKAYIDESFDGNLLDILNWPKKQEVKELDKKALIYGILVGGYDTKIARKFEDIFKLPEIYVDNRKLDHFIDYFKNSNPCSYNACGCGEYSSCKIETSSCNYCSNWARKAISFDEDKRAKWLDFTESFLKSFDNRKVFKNKDFRRR